MKLYSKALVHRLKKAGKIPRWKGKRLSIPPAVGRSIIPIAFLCYPMEPSTAMLVMAIWGALLMMMRIGDMQQMLTGKSGLEPFYFMPVTNQFAFSYAEDAIFKRSLWAIVDAAALFSHRISFTDLLPGILRLLLAAPLFGMTILASSYLVYAVFPRLQIGIAWLLAFVTGVLAILEGELWHGHFLIENAASILAIVTPSGWVATGAFGDGTLKGTWIPLAAAVMVCLTWPWVRKSLVHRFEFWGIDEPPNIDSLTTEDDEPELITVPELSRTGEVVELVSSGEFLKKGTPEGWIEHFVSRRLNRRESDLLWLLLSPRPAWSRRYLRAIPVLLLLPIAMWLIRSWSEVASWWLLVAAVVYALIAMTPFLGGIDSPLDTKIPVSNGQTSPFAILPVGIREIHTIVWKVNSLRRLFALPWYFWFSTIVMFGLKLTIFDALRWAVILWLLSVALQPVWFVFQISGISTDNQMSWRSLFFIFYFLIIGATALAVFFSMFAPSWLLGIGLCTVIAIEGFFFERLYLRWYEQKSFDLIVPYR